MAKKKISTEFYVNNDRFCHEACGGKIRQNDFKCFEKVLGIEVDGGTVSQRIKHTEHLNGECQKCGLKTIFSREYITP